MSDVFEGPGWWLASNAKWYPPENHPDERYRARYNTPAPIAEPEVVIPEVPAVQETSTTSTPQIPVLDVPVFDTPASDNTETTNLADLQHELAATEPAIPESSPAETPAVPDLAPAGFPSVELQSEPEEAARTTPLAELARSEPETIDQNAILETAELSGSDLEIEMARVAAQRAADQERAKAEVYRSISEPTEQEEARERAIAPVFDPQTANQPASTGFSVASTNFAKKPETRPSFDEARPPSVVEAPPRTAIGFTQVEIDRAEVQESPVSSGVNPDAESATPRSSSTELVHVPEASPRFAVATTRDRIISFLLFVSGVAMIVGSFLDWTTGDLLQTGWERRDGILTVATGVLGASMAGPIFVGFRHTIPKAIAIIAGIVAAITLGMVAVNTVLSTSGIEFGLGFAVVSIATAVMIIAAIADEGEAPTY